MSFTSPHSPQPPRRGPRDPRELRGRPAARRSGRANASVAGSTLASVRSCRSLLSFSSVGSLSGSGSLVQQQPGEGRIVGCGRAVCLYLDMSKWLGQGAHDGLVESYDKLANS